MVKSVLLLFCFTLFIGNAVFAQGVSSRAFQVQLEGLGPGSLFSLNIDSRFSKKENGLGFRIGLGGSPLGLLGASCNSGAQISVPAGLNYLIGSSPHFVELGAGAVLNIIDATKIYCIGFKPGFFSDETSPYEFVSAGYRFQPLHKGLTYRIFVSPLFQKDFPLKMWGGISAGYRF